MQNPHLPALLFLGFIGLITISKGMWGQKGYDPELYIKLYYNYMTHDFLDMTPSDSAVFINQIYLEKT